MGNFNDDPEDDLISSDEIEIPADSSEQTVHDHFGETCE